MEEKKRELTVSAKRYERGHRVRYHMSVIFHIFLCNIFQCGGCVVNMSLHYSSIKNMILYSIIIFVVVAFFFTMYVGFASQATQPFPSMASILLRVCV